MRTRAILSARKGCHVLLLLATVLVVVVIVGVTFAISQPEASMPDVERDAPPMGLPDDRPMTPDDVDRVRFSVALRGYRMSDVDEVLDRLRQEIATRDARIRQLEESVPSDAADGDADIPLVEGLDGGVGIPLVERSDSPSDLAPPG
jgi:DivIVA domain-containing protein